MESKISIEILKEINNPVVLKDVTCLCVNYLNIWVCRLKRRPEVCALPVEFTKSRFKYTGFDCGHAKCQSIIQANIRTDHKRWKRRNDHWKPPADAFGGCRAELLNCGWSFFFFQLKSTVLRERKWVVRMFGREGFDALDHDLSAMCSDELFSLEPLGLTACAIIIP